MPLFTGGIKAPALEIIQKILEWFAEDNWELRKQQALNAARSPYFRGGQLLAAGGVLNIPEAQPQDQVFSFLYFVTDAASGSGRYRFDNLPPDVSLALPGERGLAIFSGGFAISLAGNENIRAFKFAAEAGQTLNYSYQLFR